MHVFDITILTANTYLDDQYDDMLSQNVVVEDGLLKKALEKRGYRVHRTSWDDPTFDWSTTKYAIFRTTWDCFDRFDEFSKWLASAREKTQFINPESLIQWNLDKFYLQDFNQAGVAIPPTAFIEKGDSRSLKSHVDESGWKEFILKPAFSAGARHTYRFTREQAGEFEAIFQELILQERMLLQEFQDNILSKGEVSCMIFGGKYSHSVLKRAKVGDFRVQDDFGGTLHDYEPSSTDIEFIEKAIRVCDPIPVYARADILWDNDGKLCMGELELLEPELWFRLDDESADMCAEAIEQYVNAVD